MTQLRPPLLVWIAGAVIAGGSLVAGAPLAAPPPAIGATMTAASLAGRYDGHQTEMAAGLELGADGRFRYGLAYGALDEQAAGSWTYDGSRVWLTSDPVAAPQFVLLAATPLQTGTLKVALDLPQGMNRQYFKALIRLADGRSMERQFGDEGLDVQLGPSERVVSVALLLPVYGLEGEPAPLAGSPGGDAHFRFDPNDLGKVAFAREPLLVSPDGLRLERLGRTIVFRRAADE